MNKSRLFHLWLGFPEDPRSVSKYRLLGLNESESDPQVIDYISKNRIDYVKGQVKGNKEWKDAVLELQKLLEDAKAKVLSDVRSSQRSSQRDDGERGWLGGVVDSKINPGDWLVLGVNQAERDREVIERQYSQRLALLRKLENTTYDEEQECVRRLISLLNQALGQFLETARRVAQPGPTIIIPISDEGYTLIKEPPRQKKTVKPEPSITVKPPPVSKKKRNKRGLSPMWPIVTAAACLWIVAGIVLAQYLFSGKKANDPSVAQEAAQEVVEQSPPIAPKSKVGIAVLSNDMMATFQGASFTNLSGAKTVDADLGTHALHIQASSNEVYTVQSIVIKDSRHDITISKDSGNIVVRMDGAVIGQFAPKVNIAVQPVNKVTRPPATSAKVEITVHPEDITATFHKIPFKKNAEASFTKIDGTKTYEADVGTYSLHIKSVILDFDTRNFDIKENANHSIIVSEEIGNIVVKLDGEIIGQAVRKRVLPPIDKSKLPVLGDFDGDRIAELFGFNRVKFYILPSKGLNNAKFEKDYQEILEPVGLGNTRRAYVSKTKLGDILLGEIAGNPPTKFTSTHTKSEAQVNALFSDSRPFGRINFTGRVFYQFINYDQEAGILDTNITPGGKLIVSWTGNRMLLKKEVGEEPKSVFCLDYDGDGYSDYAYYVPGQFEIFLSTTQEWTIVTIPQKFFDDHKYTKTGWRVHYCLDYDGDQKDDLVLLSEEPNQKGSHHWIILTQDHRPPHKYSNFHFEPWGNAQKLYSFEW